MKIAIVWSAPSSAGLAPYDDPSWKIWACSPGAIPHARRFDAWFELHYYTPENLKYCGMDENYLGWLRKSPAPVYMMDVYRDIPQSTKYPKEEVYKRFGEYFYSSSIAWMLAFAIMACPEEIGLYGVDMASRDEYGYQRAGCHHFITLARLNGIKVTAPVQSDILRPEPEYGLKAFSPITAKMVARKSELQARLHAAQVKQDEAQRESLFLQGALDDLDYFQSIWSDQDHRCIVIS